MLPMEITGRMAASPSCSSKAAIPFSARPPHRQNDRFPNYALMNGLAGNHPKPPGIEVDGAQSFLLAEDGRKEKGNGTLGI
ncbi:hypothetical protein SAMN05444581_13212 [Methylocapsa palsarum]|uniref:Uncharacterized protein n=1 Tax=Methylocapsa palsarum TaxID=1612308 RepID=A0A1I4D288_9HYPH|nr:hypothetical protein SAMN05444581_13212 [Methylocapsa palsarum]